MASSTNNFSVEAEQAFSPFTSIISRLALLFALVFCSSTIDVAFDGYREARKSKRYGFLLKKPLFCATCVAVMLYCLVGVTLLRIVVSDVCDILNYTGPFFTHVAKTQIQMF